MGSSPPKDPQRLSLEDEKNSYRNAQASNVLFDALSNVVILQLMPFRDAHELWTKLQDKYGVSNIWDDCSPSTSGRIVFSTSSTSPTCGLPQGNDMVSSVGHCNDDSMLIVDDPSSLHVVIAMLPLWALTLRALQMFHMLVLIVLAYHVEIA